MAAVYDKTLKRRDFSGAAEQKEGKANAANTGKIINLMAIDSDKISSSELHAIDDFHYSYERWSRVVFV